MYKDYLNFELNIIGRNGGYIVKVESSRGEAQTTFFWPGYSTDTEENLSSLLRARLHMIEKAVLRTGGTYRTGRISDQNLVRTFGQELFDSVFRDDVRTLYFESLQDAESKEKGLRIQLRIEPSELAILPWEFMHDTREGEYLCLSQSTPVVRYPQLPSPPRNTLTVAPPLRILGMAVSPQGLSPLDINTEKMLVEESLHDLQSQGLVELEWVSGQTWRDLRHAIARGPWHIFHFIGHGDFEPQQKEGTLVLANEQGEVYALTASALGRVLAGHSSLRLVVLNSCASAQGDIHDIFSNTAAILIRRKIPAVLAMQFDISDSAAVEFTQNFYESLASVWSVDQAVTDARIALSIALPNTFEWATPVLYMRSNDGRLFAPAHKSEKNKAAVNEEDHPVDSILQVAQSEDKATIDPNELDNDRPSEPQYQEADRDLGDRGISPNLLHQLRTVLLDCGPMGSDQELRAMFVDSRIRPWRRGLPESDNAEIRVANVIDYLYDRYNQQGQNALALFLQTVSENISSEDICHQQLATLARQIEIGLYGDTSHAEVSDSPIFALAEPKTNIDAMTAPPASIPAVSETPIVAPIITPEYKSKSIGHSSTPPTVQRRRATLIDFNWVTIPAGEISIGNSPEQDEYGLRIERPQHTVIVPEFSIGRFPVTNRQYQQFLLAAMYQPPSHWLDGRIPTGKENHPVVLVSWQDAWEFCQWSGVRLPSEVEWEKAARGNDGRLYPWGNGRPTEYLCNCSNIVGDTTPVDRYPAGASMYGVLDLAGNIWEWTSSLLIPYPYSNQDGRENPKIYDRRVLRGGAFNSDAARVCCTRRYSALPSSRGRDIGFRVAMASQNLGS